MIGKLDQIEQHLKKYGSYFVSLSNDTFAPNCSDILVGYQYNSFAYKNILVPQTKCTTKKCSQFESKLLFKKYEEIPKEYKQELQCQNEFPKFTVRPQRDEENVYSCHIKFRNDFLFTATQLPNHPKKFIQHKDGKIRIAIGFPTTSFRVSNPSPEALPFVKVLIPSILRTIPRGEDNKYVFKLYVGFDKGDPYFDNEENARKVIEKVKFLTAGYPVEFEMVRCTYSFGWTTFLWNAVFQHAMQDGCDYFYQVNDDLEMKSLNWHEELIKPLKNNIKRSNLGASGPIDLNNR